MENNALAQLQALHTLQGMGGVQVQASSLNACELSLAVEQMVFRCSLLRIFASMAGQLLLKHALF